MLNLLRSALLATLLATGLASITEVIIWDGISPVTDISIIPGDTVYWTLSVDGMFGFALGETAFPLSDQYTQTFNIPGEYYYGLATSSNSVGGKVTVNSAQIFDESITTYSLQLNNTIRWQWGGEQPALPLSFSGYSPGSSQMREGAYDYTFLIPGSHHWFDEVKGSYYIFYVQDPDLSPYHANVIWFARTTLEIIPAGWYLRFYSAENRQLNVHVYKLTKSGEQSVWISPDLYKVGDSVVYGFGPGMYIARCDYDNAFSYHFRVESPKSDSDNLSPFAKTVVLVSEISLFMIGVFGLGNFLMDQFDSEAKSVKKVHVPLVGDVGDITSYALARAKERMTKVTAVA
jgi:hypothetical protein